MEASRLPLGERYPFGVLWAQVGASFLVWVGSGAWFWKSLKKRATTNQGGRASRILLATCLMLGSVFLLFGTLMQVQRQNGIVQGSLTLPAWGILTIAGSVFVILQVVAVHMLLTIVFESVTMERVAASDRQEDNVDL